MYDVTDDGLITNSTFAACGSTKFGQQMTLQMYITTMITIDHDHYNAMFQFKHHGRAT
jgi:hypothetical protein